MVALLVGAVVHQQLGRAKRVGHHHGACQVSAASGKFHHDLRVGVGGEALAAVFLGNDQGEETLGLDVLPGSRRQVHALGDVPLADQCAEGFSGAVEKGLFLRGQARLRIAEQGVPVWPAAEQLAIPPDGAGVNGVALGGGNWRQHLLEPVEHRAAEVFQAHVGDQQRYRYCNQHEPEQKDDYAGRIGSGHEDQVGGNDHQGGHRRHAQVGDYGDAEQ